MIGAQIAQSSSVLLSHEIKTRFKASPYRYDQASQSNKQGPARAQDRPRFGAHAATLRRGRASDSWYTLTAVSRTGRMRQLVGVDWDSDAVGEAPASGVATSGPRASALARMACVNASTLASIARISDLTSDRRACMSARVSALSSRMSDLSQASVPPMTASSSGSTMPAMASRSAVSRVTGRGSSRLNQVQVQRITMTRSLLEPERDEQVRRTTS